MAQVIDPATVAQDSIVFGAKVTLRDLDGDTVTSYQIVGTHEADITANMISVTSPLARALIGKEEGDEVKVSAPGGAKCYEVLSVKYT